jgi:uncharacterized damage-inducible protein DinB
MDRNALEELYEYTGWAWDRIVALIEAQPPDLYAKPAPGSGWPTIAACLSHVLGTYDGWLNGGWSGLKLGELTYPAPWPNAIEDWAALRAYRDRVRASFRQALDVTDAELHEPRYREGDQGSFMSRADILTNLLLHERGHHGDLNTLFHQHGVTGYFLDYTMYVTRRDAMVLDDGTN